MNQLRLRLNPQRREIIVDGRRQALVEKDWQVLKLLLEHAPAPARRETIVDRLWSGNWTVGNKGLNQSIWSLRTALSDNARAPCCVRTVPRVGYQWIGPRPMPEPPVFNARRNRRSTPRFAAAARVKPVLACTALLALLYWQSNARQETGLTAASASVDGETIRLQFEGGTSGILKSRHGQLAGTPVLSSDGKRIAIPVRYDNGCRLVTVDLRSQQREDYQGCPRGSDG